VKGEKRCSWQIEPESKQELDILISDKADFNPKLVRRQMQGHFILIKETTQRGR
jgi:hypothetical protein